MVEHLFILEKRDDGVRSALASGRVRITEASGKSFEIDYAENPSRDGCLRLRLGAHALSAEHLRAIADLLDAEQVRLVEERARCQRVASCS